MTSRNVLLADAKQLRWEADRDRRMNKSNWRTKKAPRRGGAGRGGGGGKPARQNIEKNRARKAVKKQYKKVFKQNRRR